MEKQTQGCSSTQVGGEGAPPAGGDARVCQGNCDRDDLKGNRKITQVIKAATEIKCWSCNGGQRWGEDTLSGLVHITDLSLSSCTGTHSNCDTSGKGK